MELLAICCFLGFAAFLLYAVAGYPLILALMVRFRPAPQVRKRFEALPVTLLLPVHNGEKFLRRKLESILALDYPRQMLEVLVISDGSSDSTEDIAREFAPRGVALLPLPRGGKPAALNAGIARASGDILFFTDVRQPLDPACLRNLVASFADPVVGAVCGDVVLGDAVTGQPAPMGLYWRYEVWMRRQLSRAGSMLVVAGALYAMRRSLAQALPADTLIDDAFQPSQLILRGYRVVLEESARSYDSPTSLDTEFHRKVRTLAGLIQLVRRMPALVTMSNPMLFHFFSYKLSRLLMPYSLLMMAVATGWLPAPWGLAAGAAQAVFYTLVLLDFAVPAGSPLKRFSSPVRTFAVLMAASLCAAWALFVPASGSWTPTEEKGVLERR